MEAKAKSGGVAEFDLNHSPEEMVPPPKSSRRARSLLYFFLFIRLS